jgi:hypothetical protein
MSERNLTAEKLKAPSQGAFFYSEGGEGGIDSFANAQSPLRGGSASLRRPLLQLPLRSSRTVIWTRVEQGSKILLPLCRITKKGPR